MSGLEPAGDAEPGARSQLCDVDLTSALTAAQGYTTLCRFFVVPVPHRSKRPVLKAWSELRLTAPQLLEHFSGTAQNIGVLLGEPSGNIIDVDLDCAQALRLASVFLAPTDAIFGRPGKPTSHWLYTVVGGTVTHEFEDIDGSMLVEFRGTGAQTVFPPSTHKDTGETIRFERAGVPARIDSDELLRDVKKIAAASILARHWPGEGSRHKAALALIGGLLRSGWSDEDTAVFVRAVAETAGDNEPEDRVKCVATTRERLTAGEPATGWKDLANHIDEKVVKKVRQWLGVKSQIAASGNVPYRATPHGLVYLKATDDGVIPVALTTWTAQIVSDVTEDDGVETRRVFNIEGSVGERERATFSVTAEEYALMKWPIKHMGVGAVTFAGLNSESHARVAVQMLSRDAERRRVFGHTGWRQIDGSWLYLHAGGAIGAGGLVKGVEVALTGALSNYVLPAPPSGAELTTAIHATLRLITLAPSRVAYAMLAAVPRVILGGVDFSEFLVGPTGVFKTEYASLIQMFFGDAFSPRTLPGSWSSTANALEDLTFRAKDTILTIDDFKPAGTFGDDKLQQMADRVLRAQANGTGRQRMKADCTLRAERPPRGLVISTGEDIPRGQSLWGRSLIHELSKGEITPESLTECQKLATTGAFARTTSAFCQWLAPRLQEVQARMKKRVEVLRFEYAAKVGSGHARLPGILANLHFGFEVLLEFAVEATNEDAITRDEARDELDKCQEGLTECGRAQLHHQLASEPTEKYRQLLASAIASGRAHVADDNGRPPKDAGAWGWRDESSTQLHSWIPMGDRIGWLDGADLYLDPNTAFKVAQAQVADGERLAVGERVLRKRLFEKNLLVSTEMETQRTYTVRHDLEDARRHVLHLRARDIVNTEGDDDSVCGIPV